MCQISGIHDTWNDESASARMKKQDEREKKVGRIEIVVWSSSIERLASPMFSLPIGTTNTLKRNLVERISFLNFNMSFLPPATAR